MSGYTGYVTRVPLELPILLINIVGLAGSTLNWSWLKWDQQLEKIWELSVAKSNVTDAKDIVWIKTVLSHIVGARFIIDRVSLLVYICNIYTILTRSWQNLLIFWMLLSFVRDIVLEIVVTVITFLLWHWGSVSTSLLLEFIVEKTILLVLSIGKWYTTIKWYTHLRAAAKIHKFTIVARKSIASIVPGRVGHSLDDECLSIATARRDKRASLLNLNEPSLGSSVNFDLRISKSVTTLITDDSRDSNDTTSDDDPIANDLSVAEKSMRMLGITAEDVMDARARIHERSYWSERDATATAAESVEEAMAHFSLAKDEEDTGDASRMIVADDAETAVDPVSRKEDIARRAPIGKEIERDDGEDRQKGTSTEKEEVAVSPLAKNGDAALVRAKELTESRDLYATPEKEMKEEARKATKIVQCPSSGNARSTEAKPCSSLVRKMEAKLRSIPESREGKGIDDIDRKRHPCEIEAQLVPFGPNAKRRRYKSPRMSSYTCLCASHANTDTRMDETDIARAIALSNSEHRSKMQIQRSHGSSGKRPVAWNSVSLARTARPSGYEKRFVAIDRPFTCRKSVQTEDLDESRSKHARRMQRCGRSADLRSIYSRTTFRRRKHAESEERDAIELRALKAYNDLTLLKDKREARTEKRHRLPPSREATVEDREALELRDSGAYNELTPLEDKQELEAKRRYDTSLNRERLMEESSEALETEALETCDDLASFDNKRETGGITRGESSIEKLGAPIAREEPIFSEGKREPGARGKCDSSKDEEDIEVPTIICDSPVADHDGNTINLSGNTRQSANSDVELEDRDAWRATRMSLNLREITRNIELTLRPRGVSLTNKNLRGRFVPENGRSREGRQRDIVDGDTAGALHGAFFFRPEMVTRIFRRAQTRLGESLPNLQTGFRREDLSMDFVCRVDNETVARDRRDSLPGVLDHERIAGDRLLLADAINDNRVGGREGSHDLCIIFIEREETPSESGTATVEDSTITESQEDEHSMDIEGDTRATSVSTSDDDHRRRTDSATNDNLPVQFIIEVLKNFGIRVSEESARRVPVERIEEYDDASNAITGNGFSTRAFDTRDVNFDEEDKDSRDQVSLDQSADTIDERNEQVPSPSNNYSSNVNIASPVNSSEHDNPFDLRGERYLKTNHINSEDKAYEIDLLRSSDVDNNDNRQFDTLNNQAERSLPYRIIENPSKISFPASPASFIELDERPASISGSNNEELPKLIRSTDSQIILEDGGRKSISNAKAESDDETSEPRDIDTLGLEPTTHDNARSENEGKDVREKTSEFPMDRVSRLNPSERLERDDSFDSTYERNDGDSETPISLEVDSSMEEFSIDTVPPRTPSDASTASS